MPENELLYDHSTVGDCEKLCRDIQKRIYDGDCRIVNLLDEKGREEPRPEVFGEENGIWQTRQYVGILEYGKEQITITSRFDATNPQPFFLWYLIENFLGESLISQESVGGACQKNLFDEFLIVRLAIQLQKAFKRGGLRAYNSFERNDGKVRGIIDVSRHIRENLELDNGRMAYRIQAYSLDNPWNILFLQACGAARKRFPNLTRRLDRRFPEFSAALRILAQSAPGWEEAGQGQILRRTEQSISNPIYRDWESVRLAARAVLRRMGTRPDKTGAPMVTGVLLDMDRLWERLLEDKLFMGAKKPFSQQSRSVLGGHVELRPDFYFPHWGTVLDAKNRSLWERTLPDAGIAKAPRGTDGEGYDFPGKGSPEGKWSEMLTPPDAVRDNVYQILGYMLALGCSQGGVVFPSHIRRDPVWDPVGPPGLAFWRIPVCIPQAEIYEDFRKRLDGELLRLREQMPVCRIVSGHPGSIAPFPVSR